MKCRYCGLEITEMMGIWRHDDGRNGFSVGWKSCDLANNKPSRTNTNVATPFSDAERVESLLNSYYEV